ncbi:porin family protein [Aquimarina sp. 2304DJ70-9]|uniref:porin family protein n=1 Tax=Aquimarina penaris TaxID=3231044 RepID=UPI003461B8DA
MKIIKTPVLYLILLLFPMISFGQDRWSVEFRPGLNFATQDLGNIDIAVGFGFEGTAAYRFMPHLSGYVGLGWNQFQEEDSFTSTNVDFEETGYTLGLQFIYPLAEPSLSYLVRVGVVYNHIEVENNDENSIADTGYGFGWQLGIGIEMRLDDKWSLRPELRFRSVARNLETESVSIDLDLNYIAIGLGISRTF